jgi:DNA helicase HerA-like ATPase
MYKNDKILVGKSEKKELAILLDKANRHGLITGASGSGKTITLKVMAESFSDAGVSVFLSDVKGDIAGCAVEGTASESLDKRLNKLGIKDFEYKKYPTVFWDLYEEKGHPVRAKVSAVGSSILSIMLGLSEAQEGVLDIVFKIAEDDNLELTDLKDLKSVLQFVGDNRKDYLTKYGNITTQSIGVIQRSLLTLEKQGADKFFGEPSLDIKDFIKLDNDGRGYINILDSQELFNNPDLYASFLLWLLTELFNKLPEVGDLDKPKIVFFFDEAHLLFNGMPNYRLKQIVQIVKLIRSRGIGLYFISQKPTDIPDEVLSQLSNRVQHTLRAYTPSEQKIVKSAADAFRTNPAFDTEKAILSLGTGEALVSFLNEKGEPEIVEKATILPPQSAMGTIDEMTRNKVINNSPLVGKYEERIDEDSAHEKITKKYEENKIKDEEEKERIAKEKEEKERIKEEEKLAKEEEKKRKEEERKAKEEAKLKEKEEKEKEKAKKNNPAYKLGKKVVNKAENKIINKLLNAIINKFTK